MVVLVPAPSFAIASPDFHPRTCGIGDHSLRLAGELRARGYSAEIFTRLPGTVHPEAPEVPVHAVASRFPIMIAEGIRRLVVQSGPSHLVIQYAPHMWGAGRFGSLATTWLALAAKRAGLDVTVIAHELFTPLLPRPDLMLGAILNRAQIVGIARAADRLLVSTDTRVEELMPFWRLGGLPGRPGVLRIGPNSLPQRRSRTTTRPRRLGFFSTFAVTKRFDVVLGAFEQVWRRWPDSELVLIGDIGGRDSRHVASIHRAIEQHPGRDRIRLTGKLPLEEVAEQIADLDLYLFPMTTGANTRSGTLPVALGSGLPVVALNGTETDLELFRDRENVLFAKSMTAEAFASSSIEILESPALAERISMGARRLYDEHLSWSRIGDAFIAALGLQSTPVGSRTPDAELARAQYPIGPVGSDRIVAR